MRKYLCSISLSVSVSLFLWRDIQIEMEIFIYIYKETYYEELAHVIRKAKSHHHQPSASWKPRKAIDVVLVQT